MIQLSSITNAISNVAHSAAVHAQNLCVNSKVDAVFRTTVGAMQSHPYITLLGVGVAVYCCRAQIGSLVNKVKEATHFLYTKATGSMTNLINLFRRSPEAMLLTPLNDSSASGSETPPLEITSTPTSTSPNVDNPEILQTGT